MEPEAQRLHATRIVVIALAAIVFAGIGFLLWMLLHLFRESRREKHSTAQAAYQDRPRH